jgi:hypothetical protein
VQLKHMDGSPVPPGKVVYGDADFPKNMASIWRLQYGHLTDSNTAPILIGVRRGLTHHSPVTFP